MFTSLFKDRRRAAARLPRSAEETLALLLQAKSLKPHRFIRCEIGPFVLAHVCRERSLIVELSGRARASEMRDDARAAFLSGMGYQVLQISRQALTAQPEKVLVQIREALGRPNRG